MGMKVSEVDMIEVDGEKINQSKKKKIFIALNKPRGVVCTTNAGVEENNIIDFLNFSERVFPIGRLDKSCLLYTSPSPRDGLLSRMPSSA